jgi:hypothetical protein
MGGDLAAANVNRAYSLAAPSIAIFTFMLFFLYPRFERGAVNAWLFQAMLMVMGVATFSFVLASLYYYRASLGSHLDDAGLALDSRRGDRFWLLGSILLFLVPSLVLFSIGLLAVGWLWLSLWVAYFLFVIRYFPRVETPTPRTGRSSGNPR